MTQFNRTPLKTERARQLRADATPFERKLWAQLRGARLNGFAFRRQHPIGPYVLDFYCAAARLAIELDGDQHGTDAGLGYDAARTRFLNRKRIRVIRFGNHELSENLDGVRDEICRALLRTPTLPSSFQGESIQS